MEKITTCKFYYQNKLDRTYLSEKLRTRLKQNVPKVMYKVPKVNFVVVSKALSIQYSF